MGVSLATDTGRKLVCSADFADKFKEAGYKANTETLKAFYDLGCLPHDAELTSMMVMVWSKHLA